ncbi:hypothetical protein CARUB_v10018284mg [Capsella rubella]|uniref:Uncharacterized protein n=1 Tax=Capsella rubella TaxID=81985 RepID=R0FQZ4_9BRAS|nr:cyclin-dependent protein kinase inhibitor SMR7 [Capsella rubella]EOA24987.1 hypothetical protein CARUB_v10018284mg [Capsella rubella]
MEISKNSQISRGLDDNDGKKWVFPKISIRASLKPVKTKLKKPARESVSAEEICVTPKRKESKTSEKLKCPAAPRKRGPVMLKCRSNNIGVEYFVPPSDLESVFILRR